MQPSTAAPQPSAARQHFDCRDAQPENDDGVELPYGETEDGLIVHVSTVPRGLACKCKCPACGDRFVARKGPKKQHHFAHHNNAACRTARESALHKLAKQILNESLCLWLPELVAEFDDFISVEFESREYRFDEAVLENRFGGIVPDVILRRGDNRLLVEFAVKHFCDPEKIERIKELGIAAIEIDLSGEDPLAMEPVAVRGAILREAPRRWLYNPKRDEAERRLAREVNERHAAEAARRAAAMRHALQAARKSRSLPAAAPEAWEVQMLALMCEAGLEQYVGVKIPGDGCFRVARPTWQSSIIDSFVIRRLEARATDTTFRTKHVLKSLERQGLVHAAYRGIRREFAAELASADPDFVPAYEVTDSYLQFLAEHGVLGQINSNWHVTRELRESWQERREGRERSERRFREIPRRAQALLEHARPDERCGVNLRRWMNTVQPSVGKSFARAIRDGDEIAYGSLVRKLDALETMARGYGEPADDLLGLPLELLRTQRVNGIREKEEQRKREAAEKARREREAREINFKLRVEELLGYTRRHWAFEACAQLRNLTPLSVAVESDAGYERACQVAMAERRRLDAECEWAQRATAWRQRLREDARVALRDEALVQMFFKNQHPHLSGQRPGEYCQDEVTYERCRVLLSQKRRR